MALSALNTPMSNGVRGHFGESGCPRLRLDRKADHRARPDFKTHSDFGTLVCRVTARFSRNNLHASGASTPSPWNGTKIYNERTNNLSWPPRRWLYAVASSILLAGFSWGRRRHRCRG